MDTSPPPPSTTKTSYPPHSPELNPHYTSVTSTAVRQPYVPPQQSSQNFQAYRQNSYAADLGASPPAGLTYQRQPYAPAQREQYHAAKSPGASATTAGRQRPFWQRQQQPQQQQEHYKHESPPPPLQEPELQLQQKEEEEAQGGGGAAMPGVKSERPLTEEPEEDSEYLPDAPPIAATPAKKGKRAKAGGRGPGTPAAAAGARGGGMATSPESIDVKTKFPVARIKRIMQADEDVGKVAQVTPVVVSKALELFMISLITQSASEARQRSSKRVTSAHLKEAVLKDEQFDFLQEIVGKIADGPSARQGDDNGEEGEEKSVAGGRRRKGAAGGGGGGRRRKGSDEI